MKFFFFCLMLLCFLLSNLMRISGVVVLPPLGESLGLSASTIGFLSSVFFYTYGLSFGPWGVLIDRRGPFRCCGIALVIAAIGSFIMMFSGSAFAIGLGRALCGLGFGSAFTGILVYFAVSVPQKDYAAYVGLSMVVGHSGTVIAVAPLGFALRLIGARGVFLIFGLVSLATGLLLLFFRKYDPQPLKEGPIEISAIFRDLWHSAKNVWSIYPLRVVFYTWGVSAGAIAALQGLWAVEWLRTAGMTQNAAFLCATSISVGLVAGPAFGGWLAKRCSNEKFTFFVVGMIAELAWVMWLGFSFLTASEVVFTIVGFSIGFFNGCAYVFMGNGARNLVSLDEYGGAIGVINMFIYILVIVFQWGSGVCLDIFRVPTTGGYSVMGFFVGFLPIVILQGLAFMLILKAKAFKLEEL